MDVMTPLQESLWLALTVLLGVCAVAFGSLVFLIVSERRDS